ncbi:hypothetical protein L1887_52874 [Cichorium endivia]|nr:hypothetical protein L1887_52874 [Cichorium endivia]
MHRPSSARSASVSAAQVAEWSGRAERNEQLHGIEGPSLAVILPKSHASSLRSFAREIVSKAGKVRDKRNTRKHLEPVPTFTSAGLRSRSPPLHSHGDRAFSLRASHWRCDVQPRGSTSRIQSRNPHRVDEKKDWERS